MAPFPSLRNLSMGSTREPMHHGGAVRRELVRILLVDDEPLLLKSYARYLERGWEHEVVNALGGAEALALLEDDKPFDLVFCDLSMPDVGGVEVHRTICEYHPELMNRFVFLTGGMLDEVTEDYVRGAGVPILSKPVRRNAFDKAIAAISCS
jgi:CheY-like chemotaxis protein